MIIPAAFRVSAWDPAKEPEIFSVAPASAPIIVALASVMVPVTVSTPERACRAPAELIPVPLSVRGSAIESVAVPPASCSAAPVAETVVAAAVPPRALALEIRRTPCPMVVTPV